MIRIQRLVYRIALLLCICTPAIAEEPAAGGISLTYENDMFNNTDRGYTNGARISWISEEKNTPRVLSSFDDYLLYPVVNRFPIFPKEGKKRLSFVAGQSMFTPDDISVRELITRDRPYAGWLYGSLGLTSDNSPRLDYLELTLGIVGPSSLAEQTQKFVHENITNSPEPMGWDHQLKDEPGFILTYERKHRGLYEFSPYGFGVDFTPHANISLGNVLTQVATGGVFRFGYDLPSDYGPPRVRPSIAGTDFFIPSKQLGWYLFAGAEGRAVARNIFLDGNTFTDSHHVDKKPLVGDINMGLAITFKHARLAYTHVVRTKEYDLQETGDRFSALTLSMRF